MMINLKSRIQKLERKSDQVNGVCIFVVDEDRYIGDSRATVIKLWSDELLL